MNEKNENLENNITSADAENSSKQENSSEGKPGREDSTESASAKGIKTARAKTFDVKKFVGIALFSAIAFCFTFFSIKVSFLSFEAKDSILTIGAFIYGPLSGVAMALISSLAELPSSTTGFFGFLMNFLSSSIFVFTASIIYSRKKSLNRAIISLYFATLFYVAGMVVLNIFITPLYLVASTKEVILLIPKLLLPFNLAKALLNTAITMLIYKPVSLALKRAGFIKGKLDFKFTRQSIVLICLAAVSIIIATVIFVLL